MAESGIEGFTKLNIQESPHGGGGPMRRGPDRVEGLDGERWSKWLVEDKSELNLVSSPDLKMEVRLLARDPDKAVTPEILVSSHERINQMIREGKVTIDEAALWQGRITDRLEKLDEAQKTARARATSAMAGGLVGRGGHKESFRPLPPYVGAVFKGGTNEVLVEDKRKIPILDIRKREDRERFIFENIRANDYLFRSPSSWKQAIDLWIQDFQVANMLARLPKEVVEKFEKDIKAVMAITASARAIEVSNGSPTDYVKTLAGADEKGNPRIDVQDEWATYLLHNDPDKMRTVLENERVKKYYDMLMRDAGLVSSDPAEDPGSIEFLRQTQNGRRISQADLITRLRNGNEGRLIEYLKDGAKRGGIQAYIEQVLLMGSRNERYMQDVDMAAARVACDLFLVNGYESWEYSIDKEGDLKLKPLKDWGGHPLRSIIEPSFVPRRLKGLYKGADSVILDLVDEAFRPESQFDQVRREERGRATNLDRMHSLAPSMATHLKKYYRLSDAIYRGLGGSMANNLPVWTSDAMYKDLPEITNLLNQVYGEESLERRNGVEENIGKELVGYMMIKFLYAKALATTVESSRPGFREMSKVIFDQENKTRPFLEVMQFLYGVDFKARSGFIQSMAGGRLRLIFRDNRFKTKEYGKLYDLLRTNDQAGGKYARVLDAAGLAVDILKAFGETSGMLGKR